MGEATHICETHDAKIYDHAHILEHNRTSRGNCDIRKVSVDGFDTPEESHFDPDN